MLNYSEVQKELQQRPRQWLITGAAGFIGSNLCYKLLQLDQKVTGLDNFSNGQKRNIEELSSLYPSFEFIEGDIRDHDLLKKIIPGHAHILHQAALGSVPRSIKNPLASHDSNVNGLLNILDVCKNSKVPLVFASSSSVYGDHPDLPKVEDKVGEPLSPYAATKATKELYAKVFARTYNIHVTGLRYFNVFGPRQNPDGDYAAVIPRWIDKTLDQKAVEIYGDGDTSRDFCYIANAVQANIMSAFHGSQRASGEVYNIAAERQTTLKQLITIIQREVNSTDPNLQTLPPTYKDFRSGDVRHSLADTKKARENFCYQPTHDVEQGLAETIQWFFDKKKESAK
jgi:UDP-N-acetylglucosamine/UDP-N-acetylgalactosamine 4-epimerase